MQYNEKICFCQARPKFLAIYPPFCDTDLIDSGSNSEDNEATGNLTDQLFL